MALIKCPKCGETISDRVVICPNCNALLNTNPSSSEKPNKSFLVSALITLLIAIVFLAIGVWAFQNGGIVFIILGMFIFAVAGFLFHEHKKAIYKEHLKNTDYSAYKNYVQQEQMKERETQDFLREQQEKKIAKKYNDYKYKCPMCGSNKIANISTVKKVVSTEMLGLASKQIGKTYQCDDCKYIW